MQWTEQVVAAFGRGHLRWYRFILAEPTIINNIVEPRTLSKIIESVILYVCFIQLKESQYICHICGCVNCLRFHSAFRCIRHLLDICICNKVSIPPQCSRHTVPGTWNRICAKSWWRIFCYLHQDIRTAWSIQSKWQRHFGKTRWHWHIITVWERAALGLFRLGAWILNSFRILIIINETTPW